MHIRRYDAGYSRRHFLKQLAAGSGAAGVLMPAWKALAETGEVTRAYPEELLSIEAYTKGQIKPGDIINADNVDLVKDLLEPVKYEQIRDMGRRLKVKASTTDLMRLSPWEYLEATLRHQGKARFDDKGNVVAPDGGPWIGGNPFPAAETALELFASLTLNWGRHDGSFYAIYEEDLGPEGRVNYSYEAGWAELSPVARTTMEPKPYWPGHEDKLRYQSIVFLSPQSSRGTSFLNIWPYDHSTFPVLYGYVPEFKRVRQFPTDQRFEPLIPGSTLYLSDAWAAGDPLYTWGNYRIVGRGPALCALDDNWNPDDKNWHHGTHGGPEGKTFWDTTVELVPEAIVCEAEPVKFPRAPVSKKRVWFDARTGLPVAMVSYDRRGQAYRSFDAAFSTYQRGDQQFLDGAHPYWSWAHVHAFDLQTRSMTRLEQVREVAGHATIANDASMYDRYLTQSALSRLGS